MLFITENRNSISFWFLVQEEIKDARKTIIYLQAVSFFHFMVFFVQVIFITEYMSSGSLKKFLNKTKEIHKYKSTKSWKRW